MAHPAQSTASISVLVARRFVAGSDLSRSRRRVAVAAGPMGGNEPMIACPPVDSNLLPGRARSSVAQTSNGGDLRAGESLSPDVFSSVHRRALLDGCKWDPPVADVSTLTPYPLLMKETAWQRLATLAERLAAETIAAEEEILARSDLLKNLGLPRALLQLLTQSTPLTPALGRAMRFDFHLTTQGWRVSEVNSDVPGGFTEASHFTQLMA